MEEENLTDPVMESRRPQTYGPLGRPQGLITTTQRANRNLVFEPDGGEKEIVRLCLNDPTTTRLL